MRDLLHKNYCSESNRLQNWFCDRIQAHPYPIYSSYDIRDAGFKIANVDGNIYPAGFNNICPTDKETSIELWRTYIHQHYGSKTQRIVLITEEHTQNPYYWDNIYTIKDSLEQAGFELKIAFPRKLTEKLVIKSAVGHELEVLSGDSEEAWLQDYKPDLLISNNDFSLDLEDWAKGFSVPINPPKELGWYQRKKSRYFKHYNDLASEFAEFLKMDPFLLRVETEEYSEFDLSSESSLHELANKTDLFLERLKASYIQRDIQQTPFAFIKNNAGTYGLAVIKVTSGAEVLDWTYKSRKKMKAAKGGREVSSVILQEGIPSVVQSEQSSAEPVIYMVGSQLAGGFLRTHSERSNTESLNTPGAVYKRLCVSDLNTSLDQAHLENVYGWSARLGLLAIQREALEMGVKFTNYDLGLDS